MRWLCKIFGHKEIETKGKKWTDDIQDVCLTCKRCDWHYIESRLTKESCPFCGSPISLMVPYKCLKNADYKKGNPIVCYCIKCGQTCIYAEQRFASQ